MEADRWRRLNELFHATLAREPTGRDQFLDAACPDDTALRDEVRSLLRAHAAASVLDRPAADAGLLPSEAGDPLIGERLGPYEVASLLGRGGMGVVYLALDTRLQRPVAIKALPPAYTQDTRLRARLRREARAAAALSHPGIATVFALEEFDQRLYLVCEYVAGRTLAALMEVRAGVISIAEVLSIAVDIARALGGAHAHGVIHRDLKPENAIDAAIEVNGVEAATSCGAGCTVYGAGTAAPVMTWIHNGAHVYPRGTSELIAAFLREHARTR